MIVYNLPAMFRRSLSCRRRNGIQWLPKGFDDLSINHPRPRYVCGGKPCEALVLVSMYMEQTYSSRNFGDGGRQGEEWISGKSGLHVHPILTHDVVVQDCLPKAFGVVLQRF